MKKRPKSGFSPKERKTPRIAPQSDPEKILDRKPAWRVGLMDFAGPFGWSKACSESLLEIQGKLKNFESQTWHEIERSGSSHFIEKSRIAKEARDRLDVLHLEDIDALYSLRLSGTERIWGIREREILKVLWWDPDHRVCPVSKSHS